MTSEVKSSILMLQAINEQPRTGEDEDAQRREDDNGGEEKRRRGS